MANLLHVGPQNILWKLQFARLEVGDLHLGVDGYASRSLQTACFCSMCLCAFSRMGEGVCDSVPKGPRPGFLHAFHPKCHLGYLIKPGRGHAATFEMANSTLIADGAGGGGDDKKGLP